MTAALRARMACAFEEWGSEHAHAFARLVRGDGAEAAPCWGRIADAFETAFDGDEDRLAVLDLVVREGSASALHLLLDASRDRPHVLSAALAMASRLPGPLQRTVVAVARAGGALPDPAALQSFHPSARALATAGADAGAQERELALFAGRIGALRAMRVQAARESHGPTTG